MRELLRISVLTMQARRFVSGFNILVVKMINYCKVKNNSLLRKGSGKG